MKDTLVFPTMATQLPYLNEFVEQLPAEFVARQLTSWQDMADKVEDFFTPEQMAQVETVVPGWQEMSTYNDGVTLTHVMCVFTGLLLSPEYQRATIVQQELMKWIVLLHDLAKIAKPGVRDQTHGFRSAVKAAKILPHRGFAIGAAYPTTFPHWAAITSSAVTRPPSGNDDIQDNSKLPEICAGIVDMFGHNTPATLVVLTVLLHMSLNVIGEWPQAAPLSNPEIKCYIMPELYPLLKMMMLADNDGWVMFDPDLQNQYRQETLAVFDMVKGMINAPDA